jgi:hypothetical protein
MSSSLCWGIAIAAVIAIGVYWLLVPRGRPRMRSVADLRAELVRMTHDEDVADRLIERMRRRNPDASEARLIALAIAELEADRR